MLNQLILENMLTILFSVFVFCFILERIVLGRKLREVPNWAIRVIAINFVQLAMVTLAGYTWEKCFSATSLIHLSNHVHSFWGGMIAHFLPPLCSTGSIVGAIK